MPSSDDEKKLKARKEHKDWLDKQDPKELKAFKEFLVEFVAHQRNLEQKRKREGRKEIDWGQATVNALNRAVRQEEEEMRKGGEALSAGTYPINNKHDLTFAIPRVGYAPDMAKAEDYIESRAKALGIWDERMDGWRDNEKD